MSFDRTIKRREEAKKLSIIATIIFSSPFRRCCPTSARPGETFLHRRGRKLFEENFLSFETSCRKFFSSLFKTFYSRWSNKFQFTPSWRERESAGRILKVTCSFQHAQRSDVVNLTLTQLWAFVVFAVSYRYRDKKLKIGSLWKSKSCHLFANLLSVYFWLRDSLMSFTEHDLQIDNWVI